MTSIGFLLFLAITAAIASANDGNQLSYLDSNEVWFPNQNFPKLTCPQWVGDEGVECVVVLAIDDMREPAKYEAYLRPILQRLKAIDGRAPVSIMTCVVKPDDPQLQSWLQEGLSLECHTFSHPCPLLAGKDIAASKGTYDKCVDLLASVPNNKPVAFRTPCCDSLNTVSPRLFSEIINKTTPGGNFLQLDSSVFTLYTPDDHSIPRELLFDADGREKFRKYVPRKLKRGEQIHDHFVNLIPNYPYPYVIQNKCWEFPCLVPSDWSANHLHKPNNPDTVRDLKIALDITVQKQGVMNLVFHPHGWIQAEQVVELIDHAIATHGKKVKFLNFHECVERLNQNVLGGHSLRDKLGADNGARLVDITTDGLMDAIVQNDQVTITRTWSAVQKKWIDSDGPPAFGKRARRHISETIIWWDGAGSIIGRYPHTIGNHWKWQDPSHSWGLIEAFNPGDGVSRAKKGHGEEIREVLTREIDGNGSREFLFQCQDASMKVVSFDPFDTEERPGQFFNVRNWFPKDVVFRDAQNRDAGLRFVDLNEDGQLDLVVSNPERYGAWLFESKERGWSIELVNAKRGTQKSDDELPLIARADGSDNGFFVYEKELCWINEDTSDQVDLMRRVPFAKLLNGRMPDAKTPNAAIKSMRVQPGYQIDLVAHEPLTMDPVAMDWGPDGKMWVAEMADYPLGIDGKGKPGGRIRYLEDTDGDGRYDKSSLFLEDVPYPNGVLAWKRGVLISAAPDVFYAADTDGDGKADVREVLFTGFAEGNQQHRVNGFSRGLDNWLYLANGDSGGTVKSLKTGQSLDLRGRDLRIRPDTGAMATVAGASQFGRNRDDWDNWFGNNNSRPMWHFVLDDHYLRRNPSLVAPRLQHDVSITPGAAPVFPSSTTLTRFNDFHTANRFTSACATIVYRDNSLFGAVDPKNPPVNPCGDRPSISHAFISEPVHNLVHHEVVTADGASFTSQRAAGEEQSEFVSSTDNWFRPTSLRTGPDGALWIADMYRLVIEHPQWIPIEWQRKLDLRAGQDKGRIWRVAPVGSRPGPIPRFNKLTPVELVGKLDSSNGWQRDLVQQLLIDMADPVTIPLLREQSRKNSNPLCRLHSLYTLAGLKDGLSAALVSDALTDACPGIRRHAVRLLESFGEPDVTTLERLSRLSDDPDVQVRLQLAYSLGEFKQPAVGALLGRLARRSSDDQYVVAAVISSVNRSNLADVLAEVIQQEPVATGLLDQLLGQAAAFDDQRALVALLSKATQPTTNGTYATWQFSAVEHFIISLSRQGKTLDQWLGGLGDDSNKVKTQLESQFLAARTIAANNELSATDRVAAVRVLGQSTAKDKDVEILGGLFTPQQPPEIQAAALIAMARLNSSEIGKVLLANFRSFGPGLRSQVCEVLTSREAWRDELLDTLEQKSLLPADLDAASRQRLLSDKSATIRQRAARLLSVEMNTDRAKLVADYLPVARAGGDVQQGGQIFRKICSQCHKLGDVGHVVGPDLTSLVDKSAEVLLTAVLDPNRAVETRYLTFTAVTKNGVTQTGIIASESSGSVTLRSAEAKEVTLLRSEIDEFQGNTKSLMPEGLERDLKPSDAAALIAYIRRNVPLPVMKRFPHNEPKVVRPDESGSLVLTPFEAEIYGSTIVLEEQHKNLGWWSSADDMAVWTISIPQADKYRFSWTWACDGQAAGNRVTVEANGKFFTKSVTATASWDDYQSTDLGELDLPAGEVRITVKPASRPLPALADVKSITLRRTK